MQKVREDSQNIFVTGEFLELFEIHRRKVDDYKCILLKLSLDVNYWIDIGFRISLMTMKYFVFIVIQTVSSTLFGYTF